MPATNRENPGVSRRSPVPLYHQVADDLRAKVTDGTWPAGARLPNEQELCSTYRVSQITLRHALRILADDGVIVRSPGTGTFVRPVTLTGGVRGLTSFTEEMEALGLKAGGVVLRKGVVSATPSLASALAVVQGFSALEAIPSTDRGRRANWLADLLPPSAALPGSR